MGYGSELHGIPGGSERALGAGDEGLDAIHLMNADGGPHAQAAAIITTGRRMGANVFDVSHGDEAGQGAVFIHQQELLDPEPVADGKRSGRAPDPQSGGIPKAAGCGPAPGCAGATP